MSTPPSPFAAPSALRTRITARRCLVKTKVKHSGGDIEMRAVGPDRDLSGQTFSCGCTHSTSCNRVRPPPTSRCVQITRMMRTQYRCVLLFALSACMHMSCARTSLAPPALFIIAFPCTTSRVQGTPLPLPSESSPPPTQQKLGSRPTRRHFRHFSDSSAATLSAQCVQEQDTHDIGHGPHSCAVPPARHA